VSRKKTGAIWPARRRLIEGLALALAASGASLPTEGVAATRMVSNCLDSGSGSLRDTIAAVTTVSNDEVTFSASLPCSTITLSSGEIPVTQVNLSISGPGAGALAISGGGIHRVFRHDGSGTLNITGLTITQGKYEANSGTARGGCLRSAGNIVLTDSTVSSCIARATASASAYGGGIFTSGDLYLIRSTLADNIVAGPSDTAMVFHRVWGGGAFVGGGLIVSYSTIVNNIANTPDHRATGGGLYTYGNAQVDQSTISGNQADSAGGWGARSPGGGNTISIVNSTISGNSASATVGAMSSVPALTLLNTTVAFNQAADADGGLYVRATLTLKSSIVADNINYLTGTASDLGGLLGTTVLGSYNLITSSTLLIPPDTIMTCPQLVGLADNGGVTRTHALKHTSPAINHGNGAQFPAIDQRGPGFPRPIGAGVDIGAYERQGAKDDGVFNGGFESTCDR